MDLTEEQKAIRREISKIAVDYDVGWKEGEREDDEEKERDVDDRDADPREPAEPEAVMGEDKKK